ncbi:MAG: hypothetical protein ACYS83_04690 [Planctomycetota bacterium]|jgi:hypothetical protein
MRRYLFIALLAVFILSLAPKLASGQPPPVSATCKISCTVTDIVEWSDTDFPPIKLPDLTPKNSRVCGSSSLVLYTNANVTITADNSDSAQLSKDALHKLVTEYSLEYDAAGVGQTGGGTVTWSDYDSFLRKGSTVKRFPGDGAVEVILSIRASHDGKSPFTSGDYTATQTLTVCWKS